MAADSANNHPAYYEVALTDKFVRDEESVKMLDLILDSVSMDNANIFSWAGIESIVGTAIYKGEAIASKVESNSARSRPPSMRSPPSSTYNHNLLMSERDESENQVGLFYFLWLGDTGPTFMTYQR